MSWIHVRDLARIFTHLLEQPSISGPVNAVASQPVQNKQFAKLLGRVLSRPAFLPVPGFFSAWF